MRKYTDDNLDSTYKLTFLTAIYDINEALFEREYQKHIMAIREMGFPELVTKNFLSYYQFEFMGFIVVREYVMNICDIEIIKAHVEISFKTALEHLIITKGDLIGCIIDLTIDNPINPNNSIDQIMSNVRR